MLSECENRQRFFEEADSNSVGLGWDLRVRISATPLGALLLFHKPLPEEQNSVVYFSVRGLPVGLAPQQRGRRQPETSPAPGRAVIHKLHLQKQAALGPQAASARPLLCVSLTVSVP